MLILGAHATYYSTLHHRIRPEPVHTYLGYIGSYHLQVSEHSSLFVTYHKGKIKCMDIQAKEKDTQKMPCFLPVLYCLGLEFKC